MEVWPCYLLEATKSLVDIAVITACYEVRIAMICVVGHIKIVDIAHVPLVLK